MTNDIAPTVTTVCLISRSTLIIPEQPINHSDPFIEIKWNK